MIKKWKQITAVLVLLVSLFIPSASLLAIAQESQTPAQNYTLPNSIKAAVKSILNEQVPEGTRVGAIVRLYNEGTRLIRVPDSEVRAKTAEGIQYTLRPSADNAINIQPKETVELSYMIVVDRDDAFDITELSWVDVDEFVSPRVEKPLLTIPVSSIEWRGDLGTLTDPSATIAWGEPFTIPAVSSALEFKPVSLSEENTPQGPKTILSLLAVNKGDKKKPIADVRINAKSDKKVFVGTKLEKETAVLDAGEQQYIHYALPAGSKDELKSLTVLIPETFMIDDKTKIEYTIGQLNVLLPGNGSAGGSAAPADAYQWNEPIRFDKLNQIIQPEVSVALVGLHMHESVGGGFKAAVAKFKLQNRSDKPMPIPQFQAQLTSTGGNKYTGIRQTTVAETLVPNISYVMYYSFIVPSTENGDQLTMDILDGQTVAPYAIPIARFKTQIQPEKADGALAFYPFTVKVNSWKVDVYMGSAKESLPYSYKLKLDLDIRLEDEAVVDKSFPKMKVVIVDGEGKIIGSKTLPFTGENQLVNGLQTIHMDSVLFEFSQTLRLYETIDTPFGQADRLIATLQQ
ncbi:hypothetical protein ACFQ88_20995 [Paenibacillus sp. NPDC056579]|uniref:hypothetical protein n=1 Tax=Paenibacillus sp. NPDC056579 TaxID=3345871 RepID=UPI003679FE6D